MGWCSGAAVSRCSRGNQSTVWFCSSRRSLGHQRRCLLPFCRVGASSLLIDAVAADSWGPPCGKDAWKALPAGGYAYSTRIVGVFPRKARCPPSYRGQEVRGSRLRPGWSRDCRPAVRCSTGTDRGIRLTTACGNTTDAGGRPMRGITERPSGGTESGCANRCSNMGVLGFKCCQKY